MIKFELKKSVKKIHIDKNIKNAFINPIIYYLIKTNDTRPFFITFVLIDFQNESLIFLSTNSNKNINLLNSQLNQNTYILRRTPHRTIQITAGKDFFTFVQEEKFFYYVNYLDEYVIIYTLDDILPNKDYKIKSLSSTFYKDDDDSNYMYISALDENNILHIYKASLDLNTITEIHTINNIEIPPHTLRKYKNMLFISHDFGNANFKIKDSNKIISSKQLAMGLQLKLKKYVTKATITSNIEANIFNEMFKKYTLKCVPGNILTVLLSNNKENYYKTNGTSPAHFEIDKNSNKVFISSHNFFVWNSKNIYVEPAVIDRFKIENNKLIYEKTFKHEGYYRFTSHKLINFKNNNYICTFAHPNRLLIIDAETMELTYYYDVEKDELSNQHNICEYLNFRTDEFEIVPLEVSKNGNYILFLSTDNIYIFDFNKKEICFKVPCKPEKENNNYKLLTAHIDYLE